MKHSVGTGGAGPVNPAPGEAEAGGVQIQGQPKVSCLARFLKGKKRARDDGPSTLS